MTTLIAVYNSEGLVGRCDARCHAAVSPECDCICGGMNHGVGHNAAVANTAALAESWIERYASEHGLDPDQHRWEIPARNPVQLSLL